MEMATDHPADDAISAGEEPIREGDGEQDISEETVEASQHHSLKYSLLGPSLLKAGQDSVDQSKVSEIIYNASKGSKFFNREEEKDKVLTVRIDQILAKKERLEQLDLTRDLRNANALIAQLEISRDLSQHIVHVDCDAFYAAVEELTRPDLKDVPFAVGGGVLTTCNYIARKFGCRSGMAGFVAKKLCPDLVLLPLNFDKYTAKATEVREVLAEYDPRFESASIDEAYLNITEYCAEHDMQPSDAVEQMRREIHAKTEITVSAGIAANAKLAKICSNINKPNGQYVMQNDRATIMTFMRDLPCRKVNGIGRVLERQLAAVGIKTCGDIYEQRQYLRPLFGEKAFEFLINCHLGLGRTRVQPAEDYERKSVGTESTFHDLSDPVKLREKLRWTADELEKDMRRAEVKGRTLVLKVKLHTFEVFTRQVVTPKAVYLADDLYNYAVPILSKLEQDMPGLRVRLMGLRCTHLVSTKKPDAMAFFGLKVRQHAQSAEDGAGSAGEWEQWPEDELDPDPDRPRDEEPAEADPTTGSPYQHHGKEIVSNPKRAADRAAPAPPPEEWWDCPICGRPQPTQERQFNEHIDLCLSRQAIRDTVQEQQQQQQQQQQHQQDNGTSRSRSSNSRGTTPDRKKTRPEPEKKRGRPPASAADPRQKKICFG